MRKSRLNPYKQYKLIKHFVTGTTARCVSKLVNVNKNSEALYLQRPCELSAHQMEQEASEIFEGEIEVNENCFGGTQKGKLGRGAVGKVPAFKLLKRRGGYTQVIRMQNHRH